MGQTQTLIEVGGGAVRLLDKPLGQGADAAIYRVDGRPDLVAKIYHKPEQDPGRRAKLEAMLANSPELSHIEHDGHRFVQIAWPLSILMDARGNLKGYLMPFVDLSRAVSLEMMLNRKTRQFSKLPEHYGYRLSAAKNVAALIAALHRKRHHVVDMKPININVYRETFFTALLDCDGFSIQGAGKRFTAHQYTPDYIAPEAIKGRQGPDQLGEEQDRFALAVILFQLLNQGVHPFQGAPKGGANLPTTNHERIGAGLYAYGLQEHPRIAPSPWSIHQSLDTRTRQLFENAFTKSPYARPSAQEWSDHLHWLLAGNDSPLQPCPNNKEHLSFGNGCPFCSVEQKAANSVKRKAKRPGQAQRPRGGTAPQPAWRAQPQYTQTPQPAAQPIVMPRKLKWGLIAALSAVVIPFLLSAILNPVIASWRWPGVTEAALDLGWPVCDSDKDYNLLYQAIASKDSSYLELALDNIHGVSCLGTVSITYAKGYIVDAGVVDGDTLWRLLQKLSSAPQNYQRWLTLESISLSYNGSYMGYYSEPLEYIDEAVSEYLATQYYQQELRDTWRQRLAVLSEDHGRRALGGETPGDELDPEYSRGRRVVNAIEESIFEPLWKWTAKHNVKDFVEILPPRPVVDLDKVDWIVATVAEDNQEGMEKLLKHPAISFQDAKLSQKQQAERDEVIATSALKAKDISQLPSAVKALPLSCDGLYSAIYTLGVGNLNIIKSRNNTTSYYSTRRRTGGSSSQITLKEGGMNYLVRQPQLACALAAMTGMKNSSGEDLQGVADFLNEMEAEAPGVKQKVLWDMARNFPQWEGEIRLILKGSRNNAERLLVWLLKDQSAVEWVDKDGETLVHYLVNWVSPELVQRLPSLGASTLRRNSSNLTLKEAYQRRLSAQGAASNQEKAALEALGRRSPAEKLDDYFFGNESNT
ncbi:uncharacterized protein with protein kinase and helix-hairpin-helix DNA-binding domains [Hahella chejuensis KCTC 2396]|uniref:Uncharacterized protein with protein kinase and helix-hairpin-helix DNA-binding domains n=1 Tax=Hahella chejuensis (strain KCTC 2396) TaxID=349521 RepID=Q2SNI9_HAHCH|nr:protein kinase/helix-hairpin-helix DNA-binding domain-containing proteins [Hahella chejuensis]ABC27785.1 uncharacterized protein with protein kinase and helix-hairpin-helix DNA-binding domains [Hahella chejuensis KCTC 2396]